MLQRMSIAILAGGLALAAAHAAPVKVVAAESVYGDIARQIGGPHVVVTSLLSNPDQDPHEFDATPAAAREIATAHLIVYNGADYDPWVQRLLSASPRAQREVVEVAGLMHKKPGENPHVWYDPAAVSLLAKVLTARLSRLDPAHRDDFAERHAAFERSMRRLLDRIVELRGKYAAMPVTATEPVFGYMAEALALRMRNGRFQLAVMNGTEPSARDIAAFEHDLRTRAVKALIFNRQTTSALAERMRAVAAQEGVPIVTVTETGTPGKSYQEWMLGQLDALDRALGRP
jgi:zinc/manganese transport system substrate-binding protein